MVRTPTFIAVRQKYSQTAKTPPLRLGGGNELVEPHLRAVREVAELCIPDHQRIRIGRRIAVFKTEHAFFGQQRVVDDEAVFVLDQMAQRRKACTVLEIVDRSEEHTSELQSLMRISYAVFCLKKKTI